ncbi:hypothetical protein S7711_07345 [Stachybotrys chartarum IBT 7711]|uniref:MICOS complex subunit MIC12 n=1 Tax=Stachybotrys chartarum (strain CBS 109288 / IBT 7711) TaxID=1280523 RepID=A0A084AI76_STACB|nr:hypothetical protein S7711_07345 [Stachybotrys chartarum IBT 7711]
MGFTSGFAGGVTVTLSVAYFSVLAHQRIREQQGQILRSQALAVQNVIDPIPAPLPPSRREIAAAQRATATEVVKDRWNHEVQNAAWWLQHKDWDEVREGIEENVAHLWTRVFGEAAVGAEQAKDKLEPLAASAKAGAERAGSDAKARARWELSRAENAAAAAATDAKVLAKNAASGTKQATEDAATEAKGVLASALEKGRGKAQEVVDKTKAAVGAAEEKAEPKADGKILRPLDPVQKALHQRYEKPGPLANKTVKEALEERYIPMDKRDNTILRGI